MPRCPTIRRVSHGVAACELDDGHEGPHKDGGVSWENLKLRFIKPLDPNFHLTSTPQSVSASLRHGMIRPSVAEANEVESGVWWVCRVLVHQDHRGKGVGKALVAVMKLACVEQGAKVVQVAPGGYDMDTARQRGFYKACGFEATAEDPEGMMYWRPDEGEGT